MSVRGILVRRRSRGDWERLADEVTVLRLLRDRVLAPFALRSSGLSRVWPLNAFLALAAVLVYVLGVQHLEPLPAPIRLEWWMLVVPFAFVEIFVVHFQFRRDTHSFSLSEIPLVLGLFFMAPDQLLLAQLIGAGGALWLHRKQPLLKLVFNLSNLAFCTGLATLLFHAVVWDEPLGRSGWVGTFAAAIAADLLSLVMIVWAISLAAGKPPQMLRLFGSGAAATFFNTTLALVTVTLVWEHPEAAWLPAVLAGLLFLAYRAYSSVTQKHESLELLYESTRLVQQSLDTGAVTLTLLGQAREMFRAERAEILLFPSEGDVALRSRLGPEDESEVMVPVRLDPREGIWARVASEGRAIWLPRPMADGRLRDHFAAQGIRDAMAAPLHGQDGIIGMMLVANRIGDVATFDQESAKLFETLSNHASVSLQNGRLIDRLRQQAAENEHQALHDALTGLPNRTLFRERVQTAIADPSGGPFAVVMMDLDGFKEVNDTLGHHNGDLLLQEMAARLTAAAGEGNTVARLSGDEFALLLRDADAASATEKAKQLLRPLDQPFVVQELTLEVGGSLGLALFPQHGTDPDTLIQRADVAMYLAKGGRTGVEVYTPERDQYSPARLALLAELRRGIEEGELGVLYQPKADVLTGRIIGAEALVRWHHPKRGLVSPDEFVPIAEHTGLLRPLTLHVLETAISQCARWREAGIDIGIAVNLSVRNLLDLELPDDVERLLRRFGVPPGSVVLEITESTIMADISRTQAVLGRFDALGVDIAIDDFGTGHSSLAYLKRLPVDELKMDKSFVFGMATNENDRLIVRSTIELGRNLGLRVVAEGVESKDVLEDLRAMGCHVAQGYYLSRPVSAAHLTARLTEPSLYGSAAQTPSGGVGDGAADAMPALRVLRRTGS